MLLGFPSSLVSFVSDLLRATNSHQLVPGLLGATRMLRLLLWILWEPSNRVINLFRLSPSLKNIVAPVVALVDRRDPHQKDTFFLFEPRLNARLYSVRGGSWV